jgi:hypothetical protein
MKSIFTFVLGLLLVIGSAKAAELEEKSAKALFLTTAGFTGANVAASSFLVYAAMHICGENHDKGKERIDGPADLFVCTMKESMSIFVEGVTGMPMATTDVAKLSSELVGITKEAAKLAQADAMKVTIGGQAQYEITKALIKQKIAASGEDKIEAARLVAESLQGLIDKG